ncbi:DUF6850 family outer membrane beta-barrel protein [Pseudopedobacter beijingensis]|uniref:DUF6850 family outer membrane beta-barrel protein n=1 Tax=Pseudopedobacter beijingensis TaxID=1207056 RepID=A0ABW4ICY3_9SPHI
MLFRNILTHLFILSVSLSYAQDKPVNSIAIREKNSLLSQHLNNLFENAALKQFQRDTSYSILAIDYLRDKKELFYSQIGQGENSFKVYSESYNNKPKSTLWGKASYSNEKILKRNFNESSSYQLIYPYVTADTVGGDLYNEVYYFSGGLNKSIEKYTFGINTSFEGTQLYRDIDPRPENKTAKIDLELAISRQVSDKYRVAIDLNGFYYTQSNKLSFVNELSYPLTFYDAGLGNYNSVLAGDPTKSTYKGFQKGIGLNLIPETKKGWFLEGKYNKFDFGKGLTKTKDNIAEIANKFYETSFGYMNIGKTEAYLVRATISHNKRLGTEAKFDSKTSGTVYPKISEDLRYSNTITNFNVFLDYEKRGYPLDWGINISGNFKQFEESYVSPNRFQQFDLIEAGIQPRISKQVNNQFIITGLIGLKYQTSLNKNKSFTGLDVSSSIYQMLENNYTYLTADTFTSLASLSIDYSVKQTLSFFINIQAQNQTNIKQNYIKVSTGFVF